MYCLYSHLSSMIPPQQIHIYSNSNINSASFQKVKIVRQWNGLPRSPVICFPRLTSSNRRGSPCAQADSSPPATLQTSARLFVYAPPVVNWRGSLERAHPEIVGLDAAGERAERARRRHHERFVGSIPYLWLGLLLQIVKSWTLVFSIFRLFASTNFFQIHHMG